MRFLYIVTRSDAIGGAQVHIVDLCRRLLDMGHEVAVLAGGEGPFQEELHRRSIPCRAIANLVRPVHPLKDALAVCSLMLEIRRWRPDLVALHTAKAGILGRVACRALKVPAVFTPHGLSVADRFSSRQAVVFRLAERILGRFSDATITVCAYERRVAALHRLASPDRLALVHNGISDVGISERACPWAQPPRILMVGRLEAPKNPGQLLRALAPLRDRPWTLELLGDGPLRASLVQETTELGLGGRVDFAGFHSDVRPFYARSQIFALASRYEAFPYTIVEAMRAGLPVVASDVGGVSEAVAHRVTGLLAGAGDQSWTDSLALLIDNTAQRQRMGDAGRRSYLEQFTEEHMIGKTLEIYNKVIAARRAGKPDSSPRPAAARVSGAS